MSQHQHTVLALLIVILAVRVMASGRLARAWSALTGSGTPAAAPAPSPQAVTGPGTAQPLFNLGALGTPGTPYGYIPQGGGA